MEYINITPEYTLRPFTLEDAEATVALFNICSIARIGTKESDLQDNLNEWTAPGFDLDTCARVLATPAGEIVGYVDLWDIDAPHVVKYCYFELHPEHWDDQLALWMLEWAEELARNRINLAPEGTRIVVPFTAWSLTFHPTQPRRSFHLGLSSGLLIRDWNFVMP